ncbi:MAG: DUF1566 domain-containing protein [Candidatus Peribacteria bacterium]|jgi:hypothetical protein|nr:DUF1566 domain-containing protein [Candidatus Peribacteria bacterium]
MPDHIELATLLDFSKASVPYISDIFTTSSNPTYPYMYWTNITLLNDHTKAWTITHNMGSSAPQVKTSPYNVRCVRY